MRRKMYLNQFRHLYVPHEKHDTLLDASSPDEFESFRACSTPRFL
jgi:hypothetical protein